jgi:5'-deoxynucleotidase YfbR-like HD superfamily hydrolase
VEPGSFIQTVSGRRIDPFDPRPEEIEIADIARALSNQCRFGGHCRVFYSVAQHASLVSDLVVERTGSAGDGLWALLHDAAEAYLVDLPHPLKHRSELGRLYRKAEERLQSVILERFRLPSTPPPLLKEIDRSLLATERRSFSAVVWHWPELDGFEPLEIELRAWRPERACRELLRRFERLEAERLCQASPEAGRR